MFVYEQLISSDFFMPQILIFKRLKEVEMIKKPFVLWILPVKSLYYKFFFI